MEMIGDRIVVEFPDRAFLGANTAGEIAEMVDGQRNVGGGGFAQRLAVIPGFGLGDPCQVLLDTVGDLQKDVGAFGDRRPAPTVLCLVGGIERQLYILGRRARHFAQLSAVDRRQVVHVAALDRLAPFAADKIAIARLERRSRRDVAFELGHVKASWVSGEVSLRLFPQAAPARRLAATQMQRERARNRHFSAVGPPHRRDGRHVPATLSRNATVGDLSTSKLP